MKKLSLYIFGTAMVTKVLFPSLRLEMFEIIAFVDERPNTWNTKYLSRPVVGVQDMHIEQCDFLLIMCRGAKEVASRLAKDYAIPQDKMALFDLYDSTNLRIAKEKGLTLPADILKMHLSPFQGLLEIIDVDILIHAPLAKSWIVPKSRGSLTNSPVKTKYCNNLLNGLNFEPNTIQPCCIDGRAAQVPSEFIYNGGYFDIKLYRKYINKCLEDIQNDTYLCDGCSSLIEIDKNVSDILKEKFNFTYIVFNQHGNFCNLKCSYCSFWQITSTPKKPYPILKLVKQLVDDKFVDKNCIFTWAGGEPTILYDFEETSLWLMSQGYFQNIYTNALKLSPSVIAILEAEKCLVRISLDAGSKDIYKKVKGIDGWEKATKTCEIYSKHCKNNLLNLKYIILDDNNELEEISNFLNFCSSIGVKNVDYSLNVRDFHSSTISQKTIKAAAFFISQAKQMGLNCQPYYIFEPYLSQINEAVATM